MPNIIEQEKVFGGEIGRVGRMCDRAHSIFVTQSARLLGSMRACIVWMNNEVSLANVWLEPDWFREDIVTIVFGIKTPALWKRLDQLKSQWIPCNCYHDFVVLNRMLRPFRGFLICLTPDLLMVSGKIEPRLVEGDTKVPTLMFD
jgi:hypothetical protein